MRISDLSLDVGSSDLPEQPQPTHHHTGLLSDDAATVTRSMFKNRMISNRSPQTPGRGTMGKPHPAHGADHADEDRKSVVIGKSVSVRVDLGCLSILTKQKKIDKRQDHLDKTKH